MVVEEIEPFPPTERDPDVGVAKPVTHYIPQAASPKAPTLAIIALRTTGPDPKADDLAELAVARLDSLEAQPTDVWTCWVRPVHNTDGKHRSGEGLYLGDALVRLRSMTRGCVFAGFNATSARAFLEGACDVWDLAPLEFGSETLDIGMMGWPLVAKSEARSTGLADLCKALGVALAPESSALEQVTATAQVYGQLMKRFGRDARLAELQADELAIIETQIQRLNVARSSYGPWRVSDGRKLTREALLEVFDALQYVAAELVRLEKQGDA